MARPVRHGGSGKNDRSEQFGADRGRHQDLPACLTVADHHRLAFAIGVQLDHSFQEGGLGPHHVLDRLAWHRVWDESDKVAGVAGAEGSANLAVSLEAANARSVPSSRIHHDKGALARVDLDPLGWNDAGKSIVDRPLETCAEHDDLGLKAQDIGCNLGQVLQILVAALAHDVGVEQATLPEVNGVVVGRVHRLRCRPIERLLVFHVLAPAVEVFEGQD